MLIRLGEFDARSFAELFDGVRALPLEEFIGKADAFPVKGYAIHSALHSVPDCQKIIKKAAVERLREKYGVSWFEETGPVHQIQFSIMKDHAVIMLDTSGAGCTSAATVKMQMKLRFVNHLLRECWTSRLSKRTPSCMTRSAAPVQS